MAEAFEGEDITKEYHERLRDLECAMGKRESRDASDLREALSGMPKLIPNVLDDLMERHESLAEFGRVVTQELRDLVYEQNVEGIKNALAALQDYKELAQSVAVGISGGVSLLMEDGAILSGFDALDTTIIPALRAYPELVQKAVAAAQDALDDDNRRGGIHGLRTIYGVRTTCPELEGVAPEAIRRYVLRCVQTEAYTDLTRSLGVLDECQDRKYIKAAYEELASIARDMSGPETRALMNIFRAASGDFRAIEAMNKALGVTAEAPIKPAAMPFEGIAKPRPWGYGGQK